MYKIRVFLELCLVLVHLEYGNDLSTDYRIVLNGRTEYSLWERRRLELSFPFVLMNHFAFSNIVSAILIKHNGN